MPLIASTWGWVSITEMNKMQFTHRREMLRRMGAASLGISPLLASHVFAATFMDVEQAQKLLLPQADSFSAVSLSLDDAKLSDIAKTTDTRVPKNFNPQIWRANQGPKTLGWVITDRVIGKYDAIDYVAGFTTAGAVTALEVLAYRESHGAEIRQAAWRQQFAGRKGPGQLRFGDDIRNISGATLSCQHVTEGMQRLSALVSLLPPMKAGA